MKRQKTYQNGKIMEEQTMMKLEAMKSYIRENNLTHLVKELVTGADMDVASAVEYVYDMKTLSKAQFASKYFG